MDKLSDKNDSDLEIVFDDDEQSEILHFQQKADWTDSDFEFISGITIEANYLGNGNLIPSQITPAFLDPLLELGAVSSTECQGKNQTVAANNSGLVNPVSPDSTGTNSALDIHQMLTREEATQSKLASEIRNDGQSGENRSSTFLNYHSNDESADVMPTLEPHYPPEIKSHQMTCDSSLRNNLPNIEFQEPLFGNKLIGKQSNPKKQKSREKAQIKCPHCAKAYTRRENLKLHIRREHSVCSIHEGVTSCQRCSECVVCCGGQCLEESTFTCSNCACEVPNADMKQHLLVQPCQTCGVHFPCSTAYTSHWQTGQCLMPTISKEMYPNVYGESSTDATHTSWNHSDEPEPYRPFGFYVPNEAVRVEVAASAQKEFPCPFCNRAFLSKQSIPLHLRTMHANAIYCRLCCRAFETYEQLVVHDNLKACTPIEAPDYIEDFPHNNGHIEPLLISSSQVEPQFVPKMKRRSSSTASVFCPFCPKAYCRKDKMIAHIKKSHLGKCWHCFCDMMLVELQQQCHLCWQQFCCSKLLKHHKCTVCMHCKLNIPALELKLHVCKRSCSSCDKLFLCATASNDHICPQGQSNRVNNTQMVSNISYAMLTGENVPN